MTGLLAGGVAAAIVAIVPQKTARRSGNIRFFRGCHSTRAG